MTHNGEHTEHPEEQWAREDRIVDIEARLARRRGLRIAGPVSFVVFAVLAAILLGGEILRQIAGSASSTWSLVFVGGYALALVVNEVSARHIIPLLDAELESLEAESAAQLRGPSGDA